MSTRKLFKTVSREERVSLQPFVDAEVLKDHPKVHPDYKKLPKGKYFRPSSFSYGMCPRLEQLKDVWTIKKVFPPKTLMTFALGTAFHSWMQNDVLGPQQVLYGRWLNIQTNEVVEGFQPSDKMFHDFLGIRLWQYIEPSIYVEGLSIRGSCDGIVVLNGKNYLLEIKTINSNQFKMLNAPKSEHEIQANTYAASGFVRVHTGIQKVDGILFYYFNKDTSETKEFITEVKGTIPDFIPGDIATYRDGVERKVLLPKHKDCTSRSEKRAKDCEGCDLCFTYGIEEQYTKAVSGGV